MAQIKGREGWLHRAYRWYWHQPQPELRTPGRVGPILDAWRRPATRHLKETDAPAEIEDPTRRTLDDALAEIASGTADFT